MMVEKFISKVSKEKWRPNKPLCDSSLSCFLSQCGPEFKVPGLYVVDSIVRQSRHQFGPEKDSFGPRFAKNFHKTFQGLFQCVPEDRVCIADLSSHDVM